MFPKLIMDRLPVGTRISVHLILEKKRYTGKICDYRDDGKAKIEFDDGDSEWLDLSEEDWRIQDLSSPDFLSVLQIQIMSLILL